MDNLIKIHMNDGNQVVSARDLHEFLEVTERFNSWCSRMFDYGFEKSTDYTPLTFSHPQNKQKLNDYALTLDCAKEISMIQRNDKGKAARKYFIEVEKQVKSLEKPKSTLDILRMTIDTLTEQQKGLAEVRYQITELKAKTTTTPDYFTVAGYGTISGTPVNLKLASSIGRKAARICKERNIPIDKVNDPRFGVVGSYPKYILEELFDREIA